MNENTTATVSEFDLDICPFCGCLPDLKQFAGHWAVICSSEFCVSTITRKTAAGQLEPSFGPVDRRRAVALWNSQRFYIHAQRTDFLWLAAHPLRAGLRSWRIPAFPAAAGMDEMTAASAPSGQQLITLAPCPFCGSKAVLFVDCFNQFRIDCASSIRQKHCFFARINGGMVPRFDRAEEAAAAWNRRAAAPAEYCRRADRLPYQQPGGSLFGVTSVALNNLTCSCCGKGFHAAVFGANSAGSASISCPSCNALVTELVFANDFHSRGYSSPAETDESFCLEADYAAFF